MNETCELCKKPKVFMEHTFKKETMLGKEFSAWCYDCNCPAFLFDELMFIREKKINIDDIKNELYAVIRQKKTILKGFDCKHHPNDNYYDIAMMEWNRRLRKIEKHKSIEKKTFELDSIDDDIKRIQHHMWGILYNA